MPRPSRRNIPADQLTQARAHQAALLDALAERTLYASRLALAEEKRDKTLAELEAAIVGARHDLTVAELRLVDLIGIEVAADMTGTPAADLRRSMKDTDR
jgi:hypothetical protein